MPNRKTLFGVRRVDDLFEKTSSIGWQRLLDDAAAAAAAAAVVL
jgi:hypothetical protein